MSPYKIEWVKFDCRNAYIKFYEEGTDRSFVAKFEPEELFEMMENGELDIVED